jgi:hypothetical protein
MWGLLRKAKQEWHGTPEIREHLRSECDGSHSVDNFGVFSCNGKRYKANHRKEQR